MKCDRDGLLGTLMSVSAGLDMRGRIEQSDCFVFENGRVWAFNDELVVSRTCEINVSGAVRAAPLLSLLKRMRDEQISIKSEGNELLIWSAGSKAGIALQAEVGNGMKSFEIGETWNELPEYFGDVIAQVCSCASRDRQYFDLCCVHLADKYAEASDNYQIVRAGLDLGLSEDLLINADSLNAVAEFDPIEYAVTPSWVSFRCATDLVASCRRYEGRYPDITPFISTAGGTRITLPAEMADAVGKAAIFASDSDTGMILIRLRAGRVLLEGQGRSGWYREQAKVDYDGEELSFWISPKLLVEVLRRSSICTLVDASRLVVEMDGLSWVGCLGA